jgi:hypothetical protein
VRHGSRDEQLALAQAIRYSPGATFTDVLLRLAQASDGRVRLAAARAMREILTPRFVPRLLAMLPERSLRPEARRSLVAIGAEALERLDAALDDPGLARQVRRHIPKTIALFEPEAAASVLMRRYATEADGAVRYQMLRALGRLRSAQPTLALDREVLERATEETVEVLVSLLSWSLRVGHAAKTNPERATRVQGLMVALLQHKQALALERLFRLLGLLHSGEDVRTIYRGLRSGKPKVRASSRELLENILQPRLRESVLGLVDELPGEAKLEQLGRPLPPEDDYESLLEELLARPGVGLRCLVAYHAGELGLAGLRGTLEGLARSSNLLLRGAVSRALALLAGSDENEEETGGS